MASGVSGGSYGPRVVGFVDILGFGDLVERADSDPTLRVTLVNALRRVRAQAAPAKGESGLRAQVFSDSLIVTANDTALGFWHLLFSLDSLAWSLLQINVLVRGGVTIGNAYHDEEMVFGVGVNEAYRLESKVARYPRIILSPTAIKKAKEYAEAPGFEAKSWQLYLNRHLRRDEDGNWHLNYLSSLHDPPLYDPCSANLWIATGQKLQRHIRERVEKRSDQPNIFEKVLWQARYWNAVVAAAGPDGGPYRLQAVALPRQKPWTHGVRLLISRFLARMQQMIR